MRTFSAPQTGSALTRPGLPRLTLTLALFTCTAWAQLPEGPGQPETTRICSQCHDLARSISLRQDREGWQGTIDKMITLGAKGTAEEFQLVVDYLAKTYPAEAIPKINANTAIGIKGVALRFSVYT
jgi:hypothetical protein